VFIIAFHVSAAVPRGSRDPESDVATVTVPSTARLGHVVTVLDVPHGYGGRLLRNAASSQEAFQVFTLQSHGRLVTRKTLGDFAGKTLVVKYQRTDPDGEETFDSLNVLVTASDKAVQFTNQPYHGTVDENQPSGTVVKGLQEFYDDIKTLPYGCSVSLSGHDADLVSLQGSPLAVTTRVDLDRERRPFLHIGVDAKCTEGSLHAMVTIRVNDVNDHFPQMDAPFYSANVHTNDILNAEPLLRVHATDLDDDTLTYHMNGHRNFVIDPATGEVRFSDTAQLLPRSFELIVYAEDEAQHRSQPSFVRIELLLPQYDRKRSHVHRRDVRDADFLLDVAATRDTIVQVIRVTDEGDLFTVALDMDNSANERFEFYSPDPDGLLLDTATGMISLISGFVYNDTTLLVDFIVNVSRDGEPSCKYSSSLHHPTETVQQYNLRICKTATYMMG
jgi:hypothetical protein